MIKIDVIPPLFKGHCCQCPREIVGGECIFIASLDPTAMAEGLEGLGQATCAECVRKMLAKCDEWSSGELTMGFKNKKGD